MYNTVIEIFHNFHKNKYLWVLGKSALLLSSDVAKPLNYKTKTTYFLKTIKLLTQTKY